MKKTTIIVMVLLVMGTTAFAQAAINTSRSNIKQGATATKTKDTIAKKVQPANPGTATGKAKPATEAATGKATGK